MGQGSQFFTVNSLITAYYAASIIIRVGMAFHKHLKLPPYRLTKRCGAETQKESIHRGCSSPHARGSPVEPGAMGGEELSSSNVFTDISFPEPDTDSQSFSEPTLHELQSKASIAGWNKLRKQMILTAVGASAMPFNQLCCICSEVAVFRCQECGPLAFFCYKCLCIQHERMHFFHVAEKWEVHTHAHLMVNFTSAQFPHSISLFPYN